MTRFFEAVPVALTPLTPIHVGCGEDFEPTNYVIDGGVLYEFDAARVALTESERDRLLSAVNREGDEAIRAVQSFFFEKRRSCIEKSWLRVPVAPAVDNWYRSRIGKVAQRESSGRTVSNQLVIERTARHPHTGKPYLPGTSLKGSIRTAWLNHIDPTPLIARDPNNPPPREERSADVEKELLGGEFFCDPFRLVKVADAAGEQVVSRVLFCVNRARDQMDPSADQRFEKNLFVVREVIVGGQYRALTGEIRLDHLPNVAGDGVPARERRIRSFEQLARACNGFYLPRFRHELDLLRRRFGNDQWIGRVEKLLTELNVDFEAGRSMLIRVGRHSGAECVTLDKRRWIQIKGGKRRPTHWSREATTIWLAAERQDENRELIPFGWLLIERLPSETKEALSAWCMDEASRLRAPSTAPQPSPLAQKAREEIWKGARLRFNRANGTLTAVGTGQIEAHALRPRGEELLGSLPPEIQEKVRRNEFVRVTARVVGRELISISYSG
ncbi:MAG: type III-A CRISPR-associated RAMP protein Csm5 [Casimicrobiaceae bacterium]|nr:type III-A CRISPR-associated RAMP protein Csm5 [Casimicrobiaceae bacterium]